MPLLTKHAILEGLGDRIYTYADRKYKQNAAESDRRVTMDYTKADPRWRNVASGVLKAAPEGTAFAEGPNQYIVPRDAAGNLLYQKPGTLYLERNFHPAMASHEIGHAKRHMDNPKGWMDQIVRNNAKKDRNIGTLWEETMANVKGRRVFSDAMKAEGLRGANKEYLKVVGPGYRSYLWSYAAHKGDQLSATGRFFKKFRQKPLVMMKHILFKK